MWKYVLLLASLSTIATAADVPIKKPWMFTLEERIALRTDPVAMRERARKHEETLRSPTPAHERGVAVDAFDGRTNPELFLPHEVFRTLMSMAFVGPSRNGASFRQGFMPEVGRHGLPIDFWERLEKVTAVYITDARTEVDLLEPATQATERGRKAREALRIKQKDLCASRAAALDAARKEFGQERFDRFLYEAIAPNMFRVEDRVADPQVLGWVAGGCR